MWIGSKCESSSAGQEALFNELTREVKTAAPCSQLTYRLRNQLERCDLTVRSELASRVSEGCSPLFTACKKGNVEIQNNLKEEPRVKLSVLLGSLFDLHFATVEIEEDKIRYEYHHYMPFRFDGIAVKKRIGYIPS